MLNNILHPETASISPLELRLAQLEVQVQALSAQLASKAREPAIAEIATIPVADAKLLLAPIQHLLDDDSINDILINGASQVYVERDGKLERTNVQFPCDRSVQQVAHAIAAHIGREVSAHKPLLDARLADGSRVNVILAPLAIDGSTISIRKFSKRGISLDRMVENGNIYNGLSGFLKVASRCRLNVIISGGTGSGKTTLLNAISEHIDPAERIVTIEDAAELRLRQPHVVRLETRPVRFTRDDEEISIRDLMRNALRMRPDRIIVGEVRGSEAFDMMQAMNTGHEGSLTTIHANHPRDALARLESMINMNHLNLPPHAIRTQIASAVHLIVQVSRMRDGMRRVTHVSEVVGMEADVVTMQDLFVYQVRGESPDGRIDGDFRWTGIMPRFLRRVAYYGQSDALAEALEVKLPKV
jgi:pilus assembly protein CpaF